MDLPQRGQSSGPGAVATVEVTLAKQAHGSPQGHATPSHTQLQRRTAVPTARVQMPDGPSGLATSNKAWTSPDGPSQMFIRSPGEIFEHMIGNFKQVTDLSCILIYFSKFTENVLELG